MITNEFFNFLAKLESNNSKEWFDQNRKEYESTVKKPFEDFSMALGIEIGKFDEEIHGDFKKNIFRINRDIRFAKDKTPYKTNRSVAYSLQGKKDHEDPGYYIELGINKCYVSGGAWCPAPDKLHKIRTEIYYNTVDFNKLITETTFKKTFTDIKGEKVKRLPKDLAEWAKESAYIYYKSFYFIHEFDLDWSFKPNFVQKIAKICQTGYGVNQFLRTAMRD